MPCRSEWNDDHCHRQQMEELDKVTQLLCYVCGELRWLSLYNGKEVKLDQAVWDWFKEHTENDAERVSESMDSFLDSCKNYTPKQLADIFIARARDVHPVSRMHEEWFLKMAKKACERKKAFKNKQELIKSALTKLSKQEKRALGLQGDDNEDAY